MMVIVTQASLGCCGLASVSGGDHLLTWVGMVSCQESSAIAESGAVAWKVRSSRSAKSCAGLLGPVSSAVTNVSWLPISAAVAALAPRATPASAATIAAVTRRAGQARTWSIRTSQWSWPVVGVTRSTDEND